VQSRAAPGTWVPLPCCTGEIRVFTRYLAGADVWHDVGRLPAPKADGAQERDTREDEVHHVDTYTSGLVFGDLKTAASRLRDWWAAWLRQLAAQHVSLQWMEQHRRDSAKH
jgi:hypothetical protein